MAAKSRGRFGVPLAVVVGWMSVTAPVVGAATPLFSVAHNPPTTATAEFDPG